MKKIIILFLSLSLMLICNDPDMKALITYSINNENIIGYEEYENLSKEAIKTAKMYENDYVMEKQIKIYNDILENKI